MRFIERLYPEAAIDGFSRFHQRMIFYNFVNALIRPEDHVLEFGAGRGVHAESEGPWLRALTTLQGKVARVIGVDIDEAVLENPEIDEAHVFKPGEALPLPDNSVDLVVSWAVFEHVADPELYAAELARVLKPGGWICAWTPNKWGYVGIGARLFPNSTHARMVRLLLPTTARGDADVFPVVYKMNTMGTLKQLFPESRFLHRTFRWTGPAGYHGNSMILARFWMFYNWLMPPFMKQSLHIFIQKRPEDGEARRAGRSHD